MKIGIIVNSTKQMGPVNVAISEYRELMKRGFDVRLFYVRSDESRKTSADLNFEKFSFTSSLGLDVIHSHSLRPDLLNVLLKLLNFIRRKDVKHFSTCHNNLGEDLMPQYGFILGKIMTILWIFLFSLMDKVFVLTSYCKLKTLKILPDNRKVILYNFAALPEPSTKSLFYDELLVDEIRGVRGRKFLMCNVLEKRKNVDVVINYFSDIPGSVLYVFGDGTERDHIENLILEKKLQHKIFLIGHVSDASIYYDLFDGLLLASSSEGFPLILLEAMQLRVPCLVNDLPIYHELFDDELIRFNINDQSSFADGLDRLSEDKARLTMSAYCKVSNNYSVDVHMHKLLRHYSK